MRKLIKNLTLNSATIHCTLQIEIASKYQAQIGWKISCNISCRISCKVEPNQLRSIIDQYNLVLAYKQNTASEDSRFSANKVFNTKWSWTSNENTYKAVFCVMNIIVS